jgi:hypothetical protein
MLVLFFLLWILKYIDFENGIREKLKIIDKLVIEEEELIYWHIQYFLWYFADAILIFSLKLSHHHDFFIIDIF